jgi:hypothetical protein
VVSEVVFIGGRSGVGKTSVSFEMHGQLSTSDIAHCVIDGDFLDMAHPPPWEHQLAERNLAAMWRNYRALGYTRLIYTNTVSVLPNIMAALLDAIDDAPKVIAVLLTCTDTTAAQRLGEREKGYGLAGHLDASTQMAAALESGSPATVHRVCTDARSLSAVAADILGITGWLPDPLPGALGKACS